MNNQEWWQLVEKHWDGLLKIVSSYHPCLRGDRYSSVEITAKQAEIACDFIRSEIRENRGNTDIIGLAIDAKNSKNGDSLHNIFNETWFGVPENLDCWNIPCFGILCDLCSEYENDN